MIPAAYSTEVERYTPGWIFEGLPITFDLDPCSPMSGPTTPAAKHYTKQDDGLRQPWAGTVWLNPPYLRTEIPRWIARLAEHGDGIALVYARTDTAWFQDSAPDAVFMLRGRVRFYDRSGQTGERRTYTSASPSLLLAYGPRCVEALRSCSLEGVFYEATETQRPPSKQPSLFGTL
jgi:hypothetical protein